MRPRGVMVGLLTAATLGCAGPRGSFQPRPDSRMGLTPEQLSETGARTAFDAIEILRPGMLLRTGQYDGQGSPAPALAVYVDGVVQVGGIDVLRRIPVDWIASIRLVGPGDPRFPVGRGGAIAVVTRRAP